MKLDVASRHLDLDPQAPDFVQNPYAAYVTLRRDCPRFFWQQYRHWCLADYESVNACLRDRRFGRQILHIATRAELGWADVQPHLKAFDDFEQHSLLELEPPVHTRLRGLINRAFLSRQIERLSPRITKLCNDLIDGFENQDEVELIEAYATPIPLTVICEILGVPVEEGPQLLNWSHDMVAMYMAKRDAEVEARAVAATIAFSDFMRAVIRERRKSPKHDLLSDLIRAEAEGGKLSEDELITTAILLLNAGHEATVHSIGNAVKSLLEVNHRGSVSALLADEVLRYDPPLHMFTRYALEDLELNGLSVKKGQTIGLLLASANRDALKFAAPDTLVPTRSPNPHVGFGAGIHFCIGAPLARLELTIALDTLWRRLPHLRMVNQPLFRDTYHFHGLKALRIGTNLI